MEPNSGALADRTEHRTLRGLAVAMGDEEGLPSFPAIASPQARTATGVPWLAAAAALTVAMAATLAPFGGAEARAAAPAASGVGKVASLQNQVETKRKAEGGWSASSLNQTLY